MKSRKKSVPLSSRTNIGESCCMEQVQAVCAQLPTMVGTPQRLREYIAESARKIFQVTVAAILVRNGNDYRLETVSADPQAAMGKTALLSHVRSFAMQATEQEKLLDFKFS